MLYCDWNAEDLGDGRYRLTCRRPKCGAVRVVPSLNYDRQCDSDGENPRHMDYGKIRQVILEYLLKHTTGTEPEMREAIGCNRVKGVLVGMAAKGELSIDTPTIEKDTVFRISIMDYRNYFDRVLVINLARRPERLSSFWKEWEKSEWPFKKPEVFAAIDGTKLPLPQGFRQGGGAWGCLQSHRQILEQAIMDNVDKILVMEDDCCFQPDFAVQIKEFLDRVPNDWEQLMIGGQHMSRPEYVCDGVDRCINCHRTHAYAIRGRFLRDLYQRWHSAQGHCDQLMGPMQDRYRVYSPAPFLCGQGGGRSDISGKTLQRKYWASGPENKVGPLSRTQYLIFELGRECNFGKAHKKCPNMHPDRFSGLNTETELSDDMILECAIRAYTEFGFGGLIGFHYYNEPTLQAERLINEDFTGIMDRIEMATSEARFVLWSNHSNPEWIRRHRHRFAQIHGYDYRDDPLGEKLDDRLIRLPVTGNQPCMRAWTEFILDCHGNHHPCCYDWRGEASLGNVFVDGFKTLLERWERFQDTIGGRVMTDDAPGACLACGHRQGGLTRFDEESARRAEAWRRNPQ